MCISRISQHWQQYIKAPPGALLRDVWGVIFAQLPLPKQAGLEFSDLL
jgi:hypothetical protein